MTRDRLRIPDDDDPRLESGDLFEVTFGKAEVEHAILVGLLEVNDHNLRCVETGCPVAEELADVAKRAASPALLDLLGVA